MSADGKMSNAEGDIVRRVSLIQSVGDLITDAHEVVMQDLIPRKTELFRLWLQAPMGPGRDAIKAEMDEVKEKIQEAYRVQTALARGGEE